MSKRYLRVLILVMFPISAGAQSLTVSIQGNTSSNVSAFTLAGGEASFDETKVRFLRSGVIVSRFLDYGVSPDLSVVGFLSGNGNRSKALVMDAEGDTLSHFDVTELVPGDPSVAIYPANTGAMLVRDNIASFSFYDSFGKIINRVSSSSQSAEGEVISEVAMDPAAQTIVIYNPQIKRNGKLGSQAGVLNNSGRLESIYSNTGRIIKDVMVSGDGQLVVLLTTNGGRSDEVVIMDRFGNELNMIEPGEDIKGVRLSEDAEHITLFSEQRVLVFSTLEGERLGSTSLRSPVVLANYFPGDEIILVMTGNSSPSAGAVNNIDFHAIHLGKRQVARESFSPGVRFNEAIRQELARTGYGRYRLEGANRQIEIRADF